MNIRLRKAPHVIALGFAALLLISAVSVDRLRTDVFWLADSAREGRRSGTPGAVESAQYIASRLLLMGFETQMQEFGSNRRNVIATSGTAETHILIGSHYDGQGRGFPSASDNAAGIAVLLEAARELAALRLPVSLVVVAFDDEEQGLNGARYYTENPVSPLENTTAAIIFDTMGRSFIDLESVPLFVLGTEYSTELSRIVHEAQEPDMIVIGTDLVGPRSDFAPFAVKRVPYLFFSNATHKDYHGTGDTPDQIDYDKLAEHVTVIVGIIEDIARSETRPVFLREPVYPRGERDTLTQYLSVVASEYPDLPEAYQLMFADLKSRIQTGNSREALQLATASLIGLATPSLSRLALTLMLGPFYEIYGNKEVAAAIYEEALKWTSPGAERRELEEKIDSLRSPIAR